MVALLAGAALVLVAQWRWPGALTVFLFVGPIGLFLFVVLPFWLCWGVSQGLRLRTRARWQVDASDQALTIRTGRGSQTIRLADIATARLATNFDLGASRFLEDSLGLFDSRGRKLVKLPASTLGLSPLLELLERRAIPLNRVQVNPPAFLDGFFDERPSPPAKSG